MSVDHVLLAVAGVALFVYLLPFAVTTAGVLLIRYTADPTPAAAEPPAGDEAYADRYAEFAALGFRPAGLVTERAWVWQDDLRRTHRVPHLVGPDGTVWVALYRLFPGGVLRTSVTVHTAGGLVRVATPGAEFTADDPDYFRTEVPTATAAELVERVRAAVAARGERPIKLSLAEGADRDCRCEARLARDIGCGQTLWFPVVFWLGPFLAAWGLAAVAADWPAARQLAAAGLVAAVTYPLFAWKLVPLLVGLGEHCPVEEPAEA